MMTEPHWPTLMVSGAMKSFTAAVNESDARLLRYALPNEKQWPGPPPRAARLTSASPNVRALKAPRPSESAAEIGNVLIAPVASPDVVRFTFVPQHGTALFASHCEPAPVVTHREADSTGFVPP